MSSMEKQLGLKKVILKNRKIAVHGWQEESDIDIFEYIDNYVKKGISYFVCTDIEKDGMLSGSSIGLYQEILKRNNEIKLIASGGVSNIDELDELRKSGLNGVIIGKAIYEGRITLKSLTTYVS